MSSSVFVESSILPADSSEYPNTSDSNLVVVYGKNGISFDDKGLENLIEEKKISSISVIRLTSPTPSMEDEEEETKKLEEMFRRQEIGSADDSLDSEDVDNSSSGDERNDTAANSSNDDHDNDKQSDKESDNELNEENKSKIRKLPRRRGRQPNAAKQKKIPRRRKRERPEIVGLRLEEFYPPDDANEIIKEALKMAGLGSDKKEKEEFDFRLLVIQNDHCYTPFTSPTQMKAKLAADKLDAEKQAANRKTGVLQPTPGKQIFVRKKLQKPESQLHKPIILTAVTKDKSFSNNHKLKKDSRDRKSIAAEENSAEDDDEVYSSVDENEDYTAGEDSDLSGSDQSAETDNDRDSDLDFDVNNPKGRKRKVKLLKTLKRSVAVTKVNPKTRRIYSQDEKPVELPNKILATTTNTPSTASAAAAATTSNTSPVVQRQKTFVKILSDSGRITVRSTPTKILNIGGQPNLLSPAVAALPPIPKKQHENKSTINTTGTTTTFNISNKTFVVKSSMDQKSQFIQTSPKISTIPSSPQTHKEIIINKQVMASPKTKGFTDLNTLIEQTEKKLPIKTYEPTTPKSSHSATITSVVTLTPTTSKGFMPIALETAAKNQLPAQISIQTHQSSTELEAEHDKQLDLINSIVQDELQKSGNTPEEKVSNINENIPELVKMLESTEKVLVATNQSTANNNMHHHINQVVEKSNNSANINIVNLPPSTTMSTTANNNNNTMGDIDIANASLLATPEGDDDDADDLPDDILQQVVELIKDDKTLQEAVEKQVFGTTNCNDPVVHSNHMILNQNPPPLAPISQNLMGNINRLQDIPHSSKSIIQMAISNLPTSSVNTSTPITKPTTTFIPLRSTAASSAAKTSPLVRKEPIQIIRGNGRVITLPPIEAPTTRAKRRAQVQPSTVSSNVNSPSSTFILSESSLDSSMHSNSSMTATVSNTAVQDKKIQDNTNRRRGSKDIIHTATAAVTGANQKATRKSSTKKTTTKTQTNKSQVEAEATESEEDDDDDDDPNKLWCICRQPHNNRFMICCDLCEDWFHGTCVSITKAMGLEMEQKGIDWTCPKCVKKLEEKKQPRITDMLLKKPEIAKTIASTSITPVVTTMGTIAIPATTTTTLTAKPMDSTISNIQVKETATNLQTAKLKLQSGQLVNLKDLNTASGVKNTHIIQTSTTATNVTTAGQKKLFVTANQPLKLTTQQGTPIRTITVVKQISNAQQQLQQLQQQQQHQQHPHNIKVIKTISPAQTTTQYNANATAAASSVVSTTKDAPSTLCIVCRKVARSNSIYCSDDCIRKHAQNALNNFMAKVSHTEPAAPSSSPLNKTAPDDKTKKKSKGLFEDLLSMADRKPKVERVNVYERKSGRVLTGSSAPTTANLKKWLQDNPTFEVIQPGSTQAMDLEKKLKVRSQHSASPTINKSATSPPPLKMFPLTTSTVTHKPDSNVGVAQTQAQSPQVHAKANRSITDYLKSSSTSASTSTSPRPSTPKQLQKYPQHVSIKADKQAKTTEESKTESKTTSKEKSSSTKRQTSTESTGKSAAVSNDGEPIRLTVRRTLKDQLLLRYREEIANDGNEAQTKDGGDHKANSMPKLTDEDIEEFAKAIELEMYNYFNRDTGVKYKAKYRSLVFNIKDRKNHTLFAKICRKLIEPKQLVRMSPDEMASQELAQWREQENKHQLEMIKKSELDLISCAKNYVLKTHKGEEVIEGKSSDYANVDATIPVEDVVSALNKSDLLDSDAVTTRKESHAMHWSDADSSFLTHSILSESHLGHEDDKIKSSSAHGKERDREREREKEKDNHRDREKDREREKRHKSKDRHRDKSRSRKRSRSHSRSHSRDRDRDRGDKRHKSAHKDERREREERDRDRDRDRDKERIKDRPDRFEHHSEGNDKKQLADKKLLAPAKQSNKYKQHEEQKVATNPMDTYNLIDQILESTKTVEEAANLVSDRDKDRDSESVRKPAQTPLPAQSNTSIATTVTTTSTATVATSSSSSSNSAQSSNFVIDITAESDQEPSSTVSIPTPPHDPYSRFIACDTSSSPFTGDDNHRYSITSLWTGNINMVDVTSFQLSLQPIVGSSAGLAKLLPKELDVVGRIGPETVWDYISKIKKSPNKEIVIIRLIPANESETATYKILYEYLDNRNRLGVIKSISSQIKDFYIYPLGAGRNIPTQLQPSERVDFYEDPQRPDVLIGIIIRVAIGSGSGGGSVAGNKRSSQTVMGVAISSGGLRKFSSRSNDIDAFTPPGSPKPKKRRQSAAHKVNQIDIDAIIKAPMAAKTQKVTPAPLTKQNDADEPYSPGGSTDDDDMPLLPVKLPGSIDAMQKDEDELKRKMEEINRQIAAQEMEIAGLLTGEPTTFGSTSSSTSNVLASISIPSNLSQILASIKTAGNDVIPPPPPLIGSLVRPSTTAQKEEYKQVDSIGSTYESKNIANVTPSNTTSRLAKLSEAELLSMVPDDIVITPSKPARYEEPPPPGV